MPQMREEFYAILVPKRATFGPIRKETGTRAWDSFRVDRIVRTLPTTNKNEVAVRLSLLLDSSIFDKLIPTVEIELSERELFVNTRVAINGEPVVPEIVSENATS